MFTWLLILRAKKQIKWLRRCTLWVQTKHLVKVGAHWPQTHVARVLSCGWPGKRLSLKGNDHVHIPYNKRRVSALLLQLTPRVRTPGTSVCDTTHHIGVTHITDAKLFRYLKSGIVGAWRQTLWVHKLWAEYLALVYHTEETDFFF